MSLNQTSQLSSWKQDEERELSQPLGRKKKDCTQQRRMMVVGHLSTLKLSMNRREGSEKERAPAKISCRTVSAYLVHETRFPSFCPPFLFGVIRVSRVVRN